MIAKRRAQYLTDDDDIDWEEKLDLSITTTTLSSGEVLIQSEKPLPAEECHNAEQIIDDEYTTGE